MPQSEIKTSGDLASAIIDMAWDHFDKVHASGITGDDTEAYEVMAGKAIDLLEQYVLMGSSEIDGVVERMARSLYRKFAMRELLSDVMAGQDEAVLPFGLLKPSARKFWEAMAREALAAQVRS